VTEVRDPGAAGFAFAGSSGGVQWHVELDRRMLLPGRLVGGRVTMRADRAFDARGVVVALVAEEHWRHEETTHGANGTSSTEIVTTRTELLREPVQVHGELHLGAGESFTATFEQPVPAMGPASLDADDAGLEWRFEVKADVPGGLDSSLEWPVIVAQPSALLRAGAITVGEFALYESVDISADGVRAAIKLEPMPLACGEGFSGKVSLEFGDSTRLQEIRAELRVNVEATVSGGQKQEITAWSGMLAGSGTYEGSIGLDLAGTLDARPLPTNELPHGKAQATFHVILARSWAPDTHLVRDVVLATTTEL